MIADCLVSQRFAPGAFVIRQGERVDGGAANACMYFVEEGEAVATKNVPKAKTTKAAAAGSTLVAVAAAESGIDANTIAESAASAGLEAETGTEAQAEADFDEVEVGRMRRGQFFGERALITSEPRAANVRAALGGGELRVAALDCAAFERLLGDCREVMRRHAKRQYDGDGGGGDSGGGGGGGGGGDSINGDSGGVNGNHQ
jgi:CRP-like cAMP-binding protein